MIVNQDFYTNSYFSNEFNFNKKCISEVLSIVINFVKNKIHSINNEENADLMIFNNNKNILFAGLDNLSISLMNLDEFQDEFCDLDAIQDIVNHIFNLKYEDIKTEYLELVNDIVNLFLDIVSYKIDLIIKYEFNLNEKFKKEYSNEYLIFKRTYNKLYYKFLNDIYKVKIHDNVKLTEYINFVVNG